MIDMGADAKKWVTLSVAMSSRDDPLSMPEVQQLCRMNAGLVLHERQSLVAHQSATTDEQRLAHGALLLDLLAGSWLWVLGAYEVFRRAKNRGGPLVTLPEFVSLNEQISEIRIVLAKREARSSGGRVRQIPGTLMLADGSMGWRYWDRRKQERQFFRAPFAREWLQAAEVMRDAVARNGDTMDRAGASQ